VYVQTLISYTKLNVLNHVRPLLFQLLALAQLETSVEAVLQIVNNAQVLQFVIYAQAHISYIKKNVLKVVLLLLLQLLALGQLGKNVKIVHWSANNV